MTAREGAVLLALMAALVLGYLAGHSAGMGDVEAALSLYEDGSYDGGCLPGWECSE